MRPFLLTLALAAATPLHAAAADLSKIDRTIKKEPAYKGKPKYCLLVFGPNAEKRVWLVLDDDVLYVDKNGNGVLTEAGKRLVPIKVDKGPDRWIFHTGKLDAGSDLLVLLGKDHDAFVFADGKYSQLAGWSLHFAASTAAAPVVHFDGPLALAPCDVDNGNNRVLLKKGKTEDFHVVVRTPGRGVGAFAYVRHTGLSVAGRSAFILSGQVGKTKPQPFVAEEISPVVEIEFSGSSARVRYILPERC